MNSRFLPILECIIAIGAAIVLVFVFVAAVASVR